MVEWERRFPSVPWRQPIVVCVDEHVGYACRLCVAEYGLTALEARALPENPELVLQHIAWHVRMMERREGT